MTQIDLLRANSKTVDCMIREGESYQKVGDKFGVTIVGKQYPSIDHVIPLAKGGLHAWSNVKLAHKGCNEQKGDRII